MVVPTGYVLLSSRIAWYNCRSFFSTSPCPSPRPLSVQYFSCLVGMRLSILFSVVLSSFCLVYPSSTHSSVCVLHLFSSRSYQFNCRCELFGSVFVPNHVVAGHSTHPHLVYLNLFLCRFVVAHVFAPCLTSVLITVLVIKG